MCVLCCAHTSSCHITRDHVCVVRCAVLCAVLCACTHVVLCMVCPQWSARVRVHGCVAVHGHHAVLCSRSTFIGQWILVINRMSN